MKTKKYFMRKMLSIMICLALLCSCIPMTAYAQTITVPEGYTGYDIESGKVTISEDGKYYIYGTGTQTSNGIAVYSGVTAEIILENVNVLAEAASSLSGMTLVGGANVTLKLKGTNTFVGNVNGAGIEVPDGATLTITSYAGDGATDGILIARGGDNGTNGGGAGIGARGLLNNIQTCGIIYIKGGTVEAIGDGGGAGIGGSTAGTTGEVHISGGRVTASAEAASFYNLAGTGIGGGFGGCVKKIVISGGTVNATGNKESAAIGCGYANQELFSDCEILLSGGMVVANGNVGYSTTGGTGGSVTVTEACDLTVTGSIAPSTDTVSFALTYDIYDARLADSQSAVLTVKAGDTTLLSRNITLSAPDKHALATANFVSLTKYQGQTVTIDITSGSLKYTWETALNRATTVSAGNKLYPVQLQFVSDGITGDITDYSISVTPDLDASEYCNTGTIKKVADYTGVLTIYVPDGTYAITVTAASLNKGNAISAAGLAFGEGKANSYRMIYESAANVPEQLVLDYGNIEFGQSDGSYYVKYYEEDSAAQKTISGINASFDYYVVQNTGDAISNQITVKNWGSTPALNLNISNLNIQCASQQYGIGLVGTTEVNLKVQSESTVTGHQDYNSGAAIMVESGAVVNLYGPGKLIAKTSANAAAIGSNFNKNNATVNIFDGADVEAHTSDAGAGIGGANDSENARVNIFGGRVTVYAAGARGAGIGSGAYGSGFVNISGGNVNVIKTEYAGGSGIGSGDGGSCTVEISGGTVTVDNQTEATYNGAAIGSAGSHSATAVVTISGGIVKADAANYAAAIGSGYSQNTSATVTITGGTVMAGTGGIGRYNNSNTTVTITGGTVMGTVNVQPTNGTDNVYKMTAELPEVGANAKVQNAEVAGSSYGFKDVYTDSDSKIYLYLPLKDAGTKTEALFAGKAYHGEVMADNTGVFEVAHVHSYEYRLSGTTITATCTADGCPDANGGSVKLSVQDAYYTGSAVTAAVEGSFTNGATYTLQYDNGSQTAPDSVGTHKATLTVSENGIEKQSLTLEYQISYLPAPAPAYSLGGHSYYDGENGTYWFQTGTAVTVAAPADFAISRTLGSGYSDTVTFLEGENGKTVYLKRSSDGALTDAITVGESIRFDGNGAVGSITIENKGLWERLLNKISFGLFSKSDMAANVTATDAESGVASIQYYVADEDLIGDASLTHAEAVSELEDAVDGSWNDYNSEITLHRNNKNVIYVKITDNAGNVSYISTDGIVLYTDAEADTESVSATYGAGEDKNVAVKLNGNTVKSLANGTTVLTAGEDYTVSAGGSITLKAAYLNTLDAGSYIFTVAYNPQGETFEAGEGNEAPVTTTFKVEISQAPLTVTAKDHTITYGDAPAANGVTCSGFVKNEDASVLEGTLGYTYSYVQFGDVGSYTITPSGLTAKNYSITFADGALSVAQKKITVTIDDKSSAYGQDIITLTAKTDGIVNNDQNVYSLSTTASKTSDVGDYAIIGTALDDNYDITFVDGNYTITKAAASVVAPPAAKELTYNKQAQVLITPGTAAGGQMLYSLDGEYYAPALPEATDADTYTVFYKVEGDSNHNDVPAESFTVTIDKKTVDLSGVKWNYTKAFRYDGLTHSVVIDESTMPEGASVSGYTEDSGIETGRRRATAVISYDDNYKGEAALYLDWAIENSWIPVEYDVSAPNSYGWLNDKFEITAANGYRVSLTNTANGNWSDNLTYTSETADGSVTFYLKNLTDGTISLAMTENYKLDTQPATGTVEFVGREIWDYFVSPITFDLFYKDEVTVKAEADDNLSDIAVIEYASSDEPLTLAAVKEIPDSDWAEYMGSFTVALDDNAKKFVYFIRITDKAGNVTYLSTNGAEYDTTAPVISGIEDGKTYYTTQSVSVTDKNLSTITVNGTSVTDISAAVILEGDKDASYTIVATDKAGNSTTVTVTMKPIETISAPIDDITENNVKSIDEERVQDVLDQAEELLTDDDMTDQEKDALEAIRDNAEKLLDKIEEVTAAIHTDSIEKVKDITDKNALPEHNQNLVNAMTDLQKAFENGENYTYEERLDILDEIRRIDEALVAIANGNAAAEQNSPAGQDQPSGTKSPLTGDDSLGLWFALLIAGSAGVLGMSALTKKKRAEEN